MPKIEVKNLSFSYPGTKKSAGIDVFKNLNITFENEKFNILLGESGCGKTTLLKIISGLEHDYDGQVLFDEVDARTLSIRKRELAYMPQNYQIYDKLTVFDNIAFPLNYGGSYSPEEILTRVRNIAKRFGIAHCLTRLPKHLSIGQQQRMMLAKVLVKDPSLILLDESLTSNDPVMKEQLFELIKEAKEELNATVIYVTHDYKDAIRYGDTLHVISENDKVITGTPLELRESKDPYLQALKKSSIIEEIK